MILFRSDLRVFVSTQPIDFRKGVHGLVALVAEGMKSNPYCGDVFVFRSKRKDRLKILVFDGMVASRSKSGEEADENRLKRLVLLAIHECS